MRIDGAWSITPRQFPDGRGVFLETFKAEVFAEAVGRRLEVAQVNTSVSDAGVLRGIHFADVPPGQAKYVTCTVGAVLDVVVDVRVGSPTFGEWESMLLDDVDRRAVFLTEGLAHAFCSLAAGSTISYLVSTGYAPEREHGIHPLDPEIGIAWPTTARDGSALTWQLSAKDQAAPSLSQAQGVLPDLESVWAHLRAPA